jgi:NAD+ diphosphatase
VTAANTVSGGGLDRMGPRRTDEAWLAERWADPASRAVVSTSEGVLVDGDWTPATVALSALPAGVETVLLGVADDGAAVFGADPGPERAAALRPDASLVGLRDVAGMSALADANVLAHATGLLNWHRRHHFCAN